MGNEEKMIEEKITFPKFCWRIIAVYIISFCIAGLIAQIYNKSILNAGTLSAIMRPINSPIVALGPVLQSVNAFFMAIILFPIRSLIINKKKGWITLFILIFGFSIFVPQAPAPGSFEGFIYTKLTIFEHLFGLPETLMFSLFFSIGFYFWYRRPKKLWNIISIILIIIVILMSTLGYLAAIGVIKQST